MSTAEHTFFSFKISYKRMCMYIYIYFSLKFLPKFGKESNNNQIGLKPIIAVIFFQSIICEYV